LLKTIKLQTVKIQNVCVTNHILKKKREIMKTSIAIRIRDMLLNSNISPLNKEYIRQVMDVEIEKNNLTKIFQRIKGRKK
jgi:hypothetical protein